jgi:hypothetical protein
MQVGVEAALEDAEETDVGGGGTRLGTSGSQPLRKLAL